MFNADQAAAATWERRRVSFALDHAGGARVVNRDTGYRWHRDASPKYGALWHQDSPRPPGVSTQVARLIAHPDTQGEDLAGALRMALAEPWVSLLRRAEQIAREELGVDRDRVRQMHDLAHAVMAHTEPLPHRVVMVVDDPAALAAAAQADAALAGTHVEAVAHRYGAARELPVGTRVPVTLAAPREELRDELLDLLRDQRPGTRYLVEPAAVAAAR